MNPYTAIEVAAIERLQPLTREAGGYLLAVDRYNGEFSGQRGIDDMKRALLGRQPAILVATGPARTARKALDGRKREIAIDLVLFVVSQHLGSLVAQLHGDDYSDADPMADPGVNQIRWDALELLLAGKLVHKDVIATKRLDHEDDVPIEPGGAEFTVWRSRFSVVAVYLEPPAAGRRLEVVEHRHNIDNGDDVNPVVVGETSADA